MIHRLSTLRRVEDLKISSLATHLADMFETIEDLTNENMELRKKLTKLQVILASLEERVEEMESHKNQ
jgi:predicted nuclease with TOPRIM domain